MKQHKWHKEIKAWADGAEIQYRIRDNDWYDVGDDPPEWNEWSEYRIKPQPNEPKYLYALELASGIVFGKSPSLQHDREYIGKIKLEVEDE